MRITRDFLAQIPRDQSFLTAYLKPILISKSDFRRWVEPRYGLPRFWFGSGPARMVSAATGRPPSAYNDDHTKRSPTKATGQADQIDPYKTGGAGKPTVKHLVESEMRRRAEHGEMLPILTEESKALSAWAAEKHPNGPRITPKTIRNSLNGVHRGLKGALGRRPKI